MKKTSCNHSSGCGHRLCTHPAGTDARMRLIKQRQKHDASRGPRPKEMAAGLAEPVGSGKVFILRKTK